MWLPFKRKSKDPVVGNPEKGLDRHAAEYRVHRIQEIASLTEKTFEDAAELADKWLIHGVYSKHGLPEGGMSEPKLQFVPHPIWDDEWMLARETFDTREGAAAHIVARGGKPLVGE